MKLDKITYNTNDKELIYGRKAKILNDVFVSEKDLKELVRDKNPNVAIAALNHRKATWNVEVEAAQRGGTEVAMTVATSTHADVQALYAATKHSNPDVAIAALNNPNISVSAIKNALASHNDEVKNAAIIIAKERNMKVPSHYLDESSDKHKMKFRDIITVTRDVCSVCGQTPCNCTSIKESEMKYQALAKAKEMHTALATISFIEMMSLMATDNPAKKEVQELETKLNDLTTEIGEFIQKYIPDVADAAAGDTEEFAEPDEKDNKQKASKAKEELKK